MFVITTGLCEDILRLEKVHLCVTCYYNMVVCGYPETGKCALLCYLLLQIGLCVDTLRQESVHCCVICYYNRFVCGHPETGKCALLCYLLLQ